MAAQTEMLLSCACLQLRTYYLFEASASEVRQEALIKAYSTSLILISRFDIADTHSNFIKFAPNYFSHILGMAAIFVMKIVSSSYSHYVDVEGGKRAFNTVLSLMRKSSVEDNDLKGRMSKILGQLWGVHYSDPTRREQAPSLTIKSRFSASILHDSLWLWRERFGGQGDSVAPPPQPEAVSISPRPPTPPPHCLDTNLVSHSSPRVPPSDFISRNVGTQLRQDHLGPLGDLTYDLDMAQEEHDWMWHVGFPSLIPGNLDFYPTTSALGFVQQNQMQR
jgi:hypothetical protein